MDLMFGLSVVDQMNGGQQMKQLAEGWSNRSPRPSSRLRRRVGAALIALGTRLAPVAEHQLAAPPAVGGAR
jgi:hypothetical protein